MNFANVIAVVLFSFAFFVSSEISKVFLETSGGGGSEFEGSSQLLSDGGVLVVGYTDSFGSISVILAKYLINGSLVWASTLDGGGNDYAYSTQETSDFGLIVTGFTTSYGGSHILLSKFHSNGSLEWSCITGQSSSKGYSVLERSDGFVVSGSSGGIGVILCKYSLNGTLLWFDALTAFSMVIMDQGGHSLRESTLDGGFVFVAHTDYFGPVDLLLVKYDSSDRFEWAATLGGSTYEQGYSVQQTTDGGYIAGGKTNSFGEGNFDFLLAKFMPGGDLDWAVTIGGTEIDEARSVQETDDGGFIITGFTGTTNPKVLVAKVSSSGVLEWMKETGTDVSSDIGMSINEVAGGEFFFVTGVSAGKFFLTILTKDGEGCQWTDTNDIVVEFVLGLSSSPNLTLPITDKFSSTSFQFVNPTQSFVSLSPNVECESDVCYGKIATSDYRCSSHGDCVSHDRCSCEDNYHGLNCEINQCSGFFSNESELVCLGRGDCIDYDRCDNCEDDYFGFECDTRLPVSLWSVIEDPTHPSSFFLISAIISPSDGGILIIGESGDALNVIKLFSSNVSVEWAFEIGSIGRGCDVVAMSDDSGYVIVASTSTSSVFPLISGMFVFLKISPSGALIFAIQMGGADAEFAFSISETSDGGVIATGKTKYSGFSTDVVVVKCDSGGNLEWASRFGSFTDDDGDCMVDVEGVSTRTCQEQGESVIETRDGEFFIVVGQTNSVGVVVGVNDLFISKFNSSGGLVWLKTLGGMEEEYAYNVKEISSGGYIVVGSTASFGVGSVDVFVVVFTEDGDVGWGFTLGGVADDSGWSVWEEEDLGEIVIVGLSDVYLSGSKDIIIVHIDSSSGDLKEVTTYEDSGIVDGIVRSVDIAADGGALIFCDRIGSTSFLLMKTYGGVDQGNCKRKVVTSSFTYQRTYGLVSHDWGEDPNFQSYTFSEESSLLGSLTLDDLTTVVFDNDDDCFELFKCFGVINGTHSCSGHGDCVGVDVCSCDSSNYFGEECEVHYCGSFMNNDTNSVCSNHGSCVDHEECICESLSGYSGANCSIYSCYNVSSLLVEESCGVHGECVGPDDCLCDEGYFTSDAEDAEPCSGDWDCFSINKDLLSSVCSNHGSCVEYNLCECEDYYLGERCEKRYGPILVRSTMNLFVLSLEMKEEDLEEVFFGLIRLEEPFECEQFVTVNSSSQNEVFTTNDVAISDYLDDVFMKVNNCTLSIYEEFKEVSGYSQYLKIDMSHVVEDQMWLSDIFEFLNWEMVLSFKKTGNDTLTEDITVQVSSIFPEAAEDTFTIRSFKRSDGEEKKNGEVKLKSNLDKCKSKLLISEKCIQPYECYSSASSDTDGYFGFFQIGYMPTTAVDGGAVSYSFAKFYYDDLESCESGLVFNEFKSFYSVDCSGSQYGDNFILYSMCSESFFSMLFSSGVAEVFLFAMIPMYLMVVIWVILCCVGCFNLELFCCRKAFLMVGLWPKRSVFEFFGIFAKSSRKQKYDELECTQSGTGNSSINEHEEEEYDDNVVDPYVKEVQTVKDGLGMLGMNVNNNVKITSTGTLGDGDGEEKGEQEEEDDCKMGLSDGCLEKLVDEEEEKDGNQHDMLELYHNSLSNTILSEVRNLDIDESKQQKLSSLMSSFYSKYQNNNRSDNNTLETTTTILEDEKEENHPNNYSSYVSTFFCCLFCGLCNCCHHCHVLCCRRFFFQFLKVGLLITAILIKDGFYLWFSSSEFLDDKDIDSMNENYIILTTVMKFNMYVIWSSIFIYLSILLLSILCYTGRFLIDPLMFSVSFGCMKEVVYYRFFKATFLMWFICINLFCYIIKFVYLDPSEKMISLNSPNFYFSIIFPESLLIFSLLGVLGYNGVASSSHLARLKGLNLFRLLKFPRAKIGFEKCFNDVDVILEEFFQLIFIVDDSKRRREIEQRVAASMGENFDDDNRVELLVEFLSNSEEYGHLNWNFLDGLTMEEIRYLREFFFPLKVGEESYWNVFHHHQIVSRKWICAFLFFPLICISGSRFL